MKNPLLKYTQEQRQEARELRSKGFTYRKIAEKLGINPPYPSKVKSLIRCGKTEDKSYRVKELRKHLNKYLLEYAEVAGSKEAREKREKIVTYIITLL